MIFSFFLNILQLSFLLQLLVGLGEMESDVWHERALNRECSVIVTPRLLTHFAEELSKPSPVTAGPGVIRGEGAATRVAGAGGQAGQAIHSIPKSVIANTEQFVKQATQSSRNGLSVVGRGLQKHSARSGPFQGIQFSHRTANSTGERVVREILNSSEKFLRREANGTKTIYDLTTGRGVNISRQGVFNGFRDLDHLVKR